MQKPNYDLVTSVRRSMTWIVGLGVLFITLWSALTHYYGSFQGGLAWLDTSKNTVQTVLDVGIRQLEYQVRSIALTSRHRSSSTSAPALEGTRSFIVQEVGGAWRVTHDLTPAYERHTPPHSSTDRSGQRAGVETSTKTDSQGSAHHDSSLRADLVQWVNRHWKSLKLGEAQGAYIVLDSKLYQAGLYRENSRGSRLFSISLRAVDDRLLSLLQVVTAVELIRVNAQGEVRATTLRCKDQCEPQLNQRVTFSGDELKQSRYVTLSLRSPYLGAYGLYHVGARELNAFSDRVELRDLSGEVIGALWLAIPENVMLYWPKVGVIGIIVLSLFLFAWIRLRLTRVIAHRLSPIVTMISEVDALYKNLLQDESRGSDTKIPAITPEQSTRGEEREPPERARDDLEKLRDMFALLRAQIELNDGLSNQLRQSQKMEVIGTLAGGVAHDFNNLMSVILFNSECLRESFEALSNGDEDQQLVPSEDYEEWSELVQEMLAACEQAKTLTRQLLSISRDQRQRERAFSVSECVTEVQSLSRRLISEHIRLTVSMDTIDLWAFGNENAFKQALMNVIINARDALNSSRAGSSGVININITQHHQERVELTTVGKLKVGDYVLFHVQDTGSGIPSEDIEHLFTPFFSSKGARGTGLGLTIVYRTIIERMKGAIRVRSAMGEGSSFELFIPSIPPHRESIRPASLPISESQVSAERIVVIEDHDIVRRTLTSALKGLGFRVRDFASGVEFIQWFEQNSTQVDLVLSDVVMPDMSGPEVRSIIHENYPQLPFIFLTGYTGEAIERYSVPPELILSKPISTTELKEKLLEVLGTSEGIPRVSHESES